MAILDRKDLDIALESGAAARTPMPTTALVNRALWGLLARGFGESDHAALVRGTDGRGMSAGDEPTTWSAGTSFDDHDQRR